MALPASVSEDVKFSDGLARYATTPFFHSCDGDPLLLQRLARGTARRTNAIYDQHSLFRRPYDEQFAILRGSSNS